MRSAHIKCNASVQGIPFGANQQQLTQALAIAPDGDAEYRVNFDGELEIALRGAIFRLQNDQFVEATFPAHGDQAYAAEIDGIVVLSVFDWLAEQEDVIDIARFRISERHGIAYDYRNPATGSYTVFGPGHWSGLLEGANGL